MDLTTVRLREYETYTFAISEEAAEAIRSISGKQDLSPEAVVCTAWGTLLTRYFNLNEVSVYVAACEKPDHAEVVVNEDGMTRKMLAEMEVGIQRSGQEQRSNHVPMNDSTYTYCWISNYNEKPSNSVAAELEGDLHCQFLYNYGVAAPQQLIIYCRLNRLHNTTFDQLYRDQLINNWEQLLLQMERFPDKRLGELKVLTPAYEHQIVALWNDTSVAFPRFQTITTLFEEQVKKSPNQVAIIEDGIEISYLTLNEKANRLAHRLRRLGVKREQAVAIIAERTAQMVIGILAILKAGGVYVPVDPDHPPDRIKYILQDSGAQLVLASSHYTGQLSMGNKAVTIDASDLDVEPMDNPEPVNEATDLIYLMYTSGSTGMPKGVMVTHRNVTRLVMNTNFVAFGPDDRILQTGSLVFDASTFEIWGALLNGLQLVLVDKTVILDPVQLEAAIRLHKVTTMFLTTALFIQLAERNPSLFLPIKQLFVGGELMSPKHMLRVALESAPIALSNIYGPTENTTFSTWYELEGSVEESVPIGKPIANSTAYVVNKYGQLQPVGAVGELWVGGEGVARGYINRADLTAEKFIESPFVSGERLYKTGDLVRLLPNGNLEFVGRVDHQVKIRGYRMELGEIEAQIQRHESIVETLVIDFEDAPGQKALCAYIVANGEMSANEIRSYLASHLPANMVPTCYMFLERMPLTINGKIDRLKLPLPKKQGWISDNYIAPQTETERMLVGIWEEVLGFAPIGAADHFFDLGGHSLQVSRIQALIEQACGLLLTCKQFFESPVLRDLALQLDNQELRSVVKIEVAAERKMYTLGTAQRRMFALQQRMGIGAAYHIPFLYRMEGKLDRARLLNALKQIIRRHEALRTSFHYENGEIGQRIAAMADVVFEIDYRDRTNERLSEQSVNELVEWFKCRFELEESPLMKAAVVSFADEEHLFLLNIHHIVFDGASLRIFADELCALYAGKELVPLKLQFKDYAEWHADKIKFDVQAEQYWLNVLDGELPELNLSLDFHRPSKQSFEGEVVRTRLSVEQTALLRQFAKERGCTMYMVLLSVYHVLLARYGDKEDIIVGCAVAARSHADLHDMIGMFVNTLPIRSYPESSKSFARFLAEMKDTLLHAYEYQDYPLEHLIEKKQLKSDLSRNPLFDTVFVMQNMGSVDIRLPGLSCTNIPVHNETSKFDLTLEAIEQADSVTFTFEYAAKLFKREKMIRFADHFVQLVHEATANPALPIAQLNILTTSERQQIIQQFNDTASAYPRDSSVVALFEQQVLRTPHKVAVETKDRKLTYTELNQEANRLGHHLRSNGVIAEQPVVLFAERSADMIIGVLAILKAGGAYVPIDPDYPAERIQYMIKDSGAAVALSNKQLAHRLPFKVNTIVFDDLELNEHPIENIGNPPGPNHLMYIMYTSGSTGNPKGVMITHRNVIRLVQNTDFVPFQEDNCLLQTGSLVFDASTFEIWGTLLNGLRLVLVDKTTVLDAVQLGSAIQEYGITMMWLTSPLFTQLAEKDVHIFKPIRVLLVGGDVLSPKHIYRVRNSCKPIMIINGYGPTENTTFSTCFPIEEESEGSIPIGKPIANSTAYVVNGAGMLQPIGVPGELWVGGDGVGRGYLNRVDLTQVAFINSSFRMGEKLYKTGDLVRWLPNGNLEFLGRKDHQVKIRGYRMELGEIEAHIRNHEWVKEVLVIDMEEQSGTKALCAYIVADRVMASKDVRDFALQRMPDYMIPTYYAFLEQLPLTTNGKVDRAKLPAPEKQACMASGNFAAPANETEQKLATLWKDLLGLIEVSVEDNFFELGGHSLKAISLIAWLKREYVVEVSDVYQYPTIRQLAQHMKFRPNHLKDKLSQLRDRMQADRERNEQGNKSLVGERELYKENISIYMAQVKHALQEENAYTDVLLTGSTGYLGAYLLRDLIEQQKSCQVTVIVRGDSQEHAKQRLLHKLTHYFGFAWVEQSCDRIHIVNGNLSDTKFGLDDRQYAQLAAEVDCIIHAAANVKHYGPYDEFENSNIRATEHLTQFAMAVKAKPFHHVSTMSVGMGTINNIESVYFTEYDLDLGQQHNNYYVKTKFEAEKVVHAARKQGLIANIYRIGNIVFDSVSGKFQENIQDNAFYNRMKSFIQLGAVPITEADIDLTYVDQVSGALLTLFNKPALHQHTFHLYNPKFVSMSDILADQEECSVEEQSTEVFFDMLYTAYIQGDHMHAVENMLLHSGWMDEKVDSTYFELTAELTLNLLKQMGFSWDVPENRHISAMLRHCRRVGFLE
ncbi:amino acid adenylation domain-containing protein [Paenibacillus sp. SC116]|uniref:non-ribosomal peptide synthetase n=1 Tax=Paenibacillus sp. SC116 TaxID=2968986 RepID=UPI00215A13C6|nr:non-ribosomal peptide synthetase [Paenibacillus sp. SC116]MCR8842232.1 amino acid adenylation domain-containing protein [Paenibacillus sp. SC116]